MSTREKINILIVDDQPAKLLSLETIVASLDENILKAASAEEALHTLLNSDVAVVLVDVCMPGMDGFELAEMIRSHPRFGRTAIIFISAVHLTDEDRLKGYALGAVDYIPVPIIQEVLRAKVSVFVDLYRKTEQFKRLNQELEARVAERTADLEAVRARDRETLERLVAERTAELEHSNERLRITDRMATIGTLSAGLGHDMGNLLLPVRLRLEAIEAAPLPPAVQEDVAAIRKATDYLQQLARSLRMLAIDPQRESGREFVTDLASWWNDSEGMLRNGVQRPTLLSARVPPGLPALLIGPAALTQIAFNIVQNAGDILRGREDGHIQIEASATPAGDAVRIAISDNGPGMSDDTKRRCMEPFFTTKTRGLSTGLGLSLVGGLVNSAGGAIHIESAPGKGTVFSITLPAAPVLKDEAVPDTAGANAGIAVVCLDDDRLLAHVTSILAALHFETRTQPANGQPLSCPPDDADLWITIARNAQESRAAAAFLQARPNRRAIVFTTLADEPSPVGPALIRFDPRIRPSELRTRLRAALVDSQPAPTGAPR